MGLAGCSTTTRTASNSVPGTTTASQQLTIGVSAQLSSADQDSSILLPSSCSLQNGTLTAEGTFNGGFAPEGYVRYGDVVELYAYTVPATAGGQATQVAELEMEKPFSMAGSGPWKVTAPVDAQLGTPDQCLVAVQSTHAFMGAGNAGG
jgi:hypothetical protein